MELVARISRSADTVLGARDSLPCSAGLSKVPAFANRPPRIEFVRRWDSAEPGWDVRRFISGGEPERVQNCSTS